jgi:hypothetical protein
MANLEKIAAIDAQLKSLGYDPSAGIKTGGESPELLAKIRSDLNSGIPELRDYAANFQQKINERQGVSEVGRTLARTGRSVGKAALDLADLVGTPFRYGLEKATGKKLKGLSPWLTEKFDEATGNYAVPTSSGERIADTISENVATLPYGGALAKGLTWAAKLPKFSHFLKEGSKLNATNVGAAMGAGAGQGLAQEGEFGVPGTIGASLAGGIAGGLAGARGSQGLRNQFKRFVNPETVESYKKLGMNPGLLDVTDSLRLHQRADILPRSFGSQAIMKNKRAVTNKKLHEAFGNLHHSKVEPWEAGDLAVRGAEKVQRGKEAANKSAYKKLDQDLALYEQMVKTPASSKNDIFASAKKPLPKTHVALHEVGDFMEQLKGKPWNKGMKYARDLANLEQKGKLDYRMATGWLTKIGNEIKSNKIQGNYKEGELKHLYGQLLKDVERSTEPRLAQVGEHAVKNFKTVRSDYKDYARDLVPYLNKIMAPHLKKGESGHDVFKILKEDLGSGARILSRIDQGLSGTEKGIVRQSLLKDLGTRQGEFVPFVMATNFKKLPEKTKRLLLSNLGMEDRKKFDAAIEAIDASKEVMKSANFSNSARQLGSVSEFDIGTEAAYNALSGQIRKNATLLQKLIEKMGVSGIARNLEARAYTSPKTVDWIMGKPQRGGRSGLNPVIHLNSFKRKKD